MRRRERARAVDLAVLQAETAQLQVETLRSELAELHRDLARRDVEMISALTRLAAVTDRLRVETGQDRTDQARLVKALERLTMFLAAPPLPTRADQGAGTIIGGSIDPSRAVEPEPPVEPEPAIGRAPSVVAGPTTESPASEPVIDLTYDLPYELPVAPSTRHEAPLACEVHLQFGDRWIDGFQIEETVRDGEAVQFRLRRRVDGWVLPELFDESEVRVFTQPVVEPDAVRNVPPATSRFRN